MSGNHGFVSAKGNTWCDVCGDRLDQHEPKGTFACPICGSESYSFTYFRRDFGISQSDREASMNYPLRQRVAESPRKRRRFYSSTVTALANMQKAIMLRKSCSGSMERRLCTAYTAQNTRGARWLWFLQLPSSCARFTG
jgi:predicted RNA-binding Zn-ribbon protein involved in translation (DUF1610 family)